MARSPLTLAASVTSALPRVGVVGFGVLTERSAGRYDAAVADLDDGRRVVVRAPAEPSAAAELAAEARALRALTPGVRGLLPFRAPELLGEAGLGDSRAMVVDFLPGYRVDAAHLPAGRGAATSIGEALAALHALPLSIVRTEGLPVRTPQQVRDDAAHVIDRAGATGSVPAALLVRWKRAIAADELWRFESAVILGGAGAASFLFEDAAGEPRVTGVLEWHGLSVGDPAADLQWLASAPIAADDVYAAYAQNSPRSPDALVRERARLYAELEFAKWLVHGSDSDRADIVDDAAQLLDSLAAGVRGDDIVPDAELGVDEAIALLDRVPDAAPPTGPAGSTSMQTDAYDAEELSLWLAAGPDSVLGSAAEPAPPPGRHSGGTDQNHANRSAARHPHTAPQMVDDASTAPIDLSAWTRPRSPSTPTPPDAGSAAANAADRIDGKSDVEAEAERASDAALRRWLAD